MIKQLKLKSENLRQKSKEMRVKSLKLRDDSEDLRSGFYIKKTKEKYAI